MVSAEQYIEDDIDGLNLRDPPPLDSSYTIFSLDWPGLSSRPVFFSIVIMDTSGSTKTVLNSKIILLPLHEF